MKKKKVVLQTDFSLAKTGFGRNAKAILEYLYKTDKYDLVHYCIGLPIGHPELTRTPWKSVGCLPNDPAQIQEINKDPHLARQASYGAWGLDKMIQEEKPDVYIAAQDIWGVDFAIDKKWFNKINSVIWTTLDSLPILPSAVHAASKVKNFWVWSDFATKALHKLGHKHVRTVHGAVEARHFKRLPDTERFLLRQNNNIPQNAFIVGFVFRNQLRKSVPNLLEGYKIFTNNHPEIKNPRLLLHTHWAEGWNIYRIADEYGVNKSEILTTYVCKNCNQYEIKPFQGHDMNCKHCGAEKMQITTGPGLGVSEDHLNEIYNLMDIYLHPTTSGGQEIPVQEAKLCQLTTLVTNYSYGEEMCQNGSGSLPLDWAEYRECGTDFIKSSTYPYSIAKQLGKFYNMSATEKEKNGIMSRKWTLNNFSTEVIGKAIEEFIDDAPSIPNFDFQPSQVQDDEVWLGETHKGFLGKEINKSSPELELLKNL